MAGVLTTIKAESIKAALEKVSSVPANIEYSENGARIYWLPQNQKAMQLWIESNINRAKTPSDVNLDLSPVIIPLAVKKALPWALGAVLAGYLLGRGGRG